MYNWIEEIWECLEIFNMWFSQLDMSVQIFVAVLCGIVTGMLFVFFGDIVTPDEII